ncbi:response regulator (plasmid) [Streptomyces sp. QTS137]
MRADFVTVLSAQPDMEVVGEAVNGREAIRSARELKPDVVVMDIRTPLLVGIEATRRLTGPDSAIPRQDPRRDDLQRRRVVYEALRPGASGFLLEDAPPPELINAVRVVARGESLLAPAVTRTLIGRFAERVRPSAAPASPERERLKVLTPASTRSSSSSARACRTPKSPTELVISHETVKTYVSRILTKLDLCDRVQAVVLALSGGVGWGTATEPDGPVMPCGAASRQQRLVPAHSSSDTPHGGRSVLRIGPGSPERATCFVLSGVTRATGGLLLTRIVNTTAGQGRPAQ